MFLAVSALLEQQILVIVNSKNKCFGCKNKYFQDVYVLIYILKYQLLLNSIVPSKQHQGQTLDLLDAQ